MRMSIRADGVWLIAYGTEKEYQSKIQNQISGQWQSVPEGVNTLRESLTVLLQTFLLGLSHVLTVLCDKRPGNHLEGRTQCDL